MVELAQHIHEGEDIQIITPRRAFDYTKWQENLFEDMTIEELAKKADEYVKNSNGGHKK
jgi:hypothetical protein